ncbi:MAG: hypothetical protein GY874_20605 [Desulfobacteraceae bacterium]|nr:hypothetical protein [Desulfobacteraceae bacterium]
MKGCVIIPISYKPANARQNIQRTIQNLLYTNELSPEFHREVKALRYSDQEVETFYQNIRSEIIFHLTEKIKLYTQKLCIRDIEAAATVVCYATEEVKHAIKTFKNQIEEDRPIQALSNMIHSYLFKS